MKMNVRDLTIAFNTTFGQKRTQSAIRSFLRNNNIKCGRTHKDRYVNRLRLYTEDQIRWLRENYKNISIADITDKFNDKFGTNFTKKQINIAIRNRKMISGRTGRFEKHQIPWNKNKKGSIKPNKTSFKPGNRPHNTKYCWYERTSKDGYIEISVPEKNKHTGYHRRFKPKHVWIWEKHNGPVPENHVVAFKDGNQENIDPDNLILLSRLELLRLNQLKHKKAPEEIQPSLIALARLEAKAISIKKNR